MPSSFTLRFTTTVWVVSSIVGTYFFSRPRKRTFQTKLSREQQNELDRNLLTPANATFGVVWPVIYAGAIGWAIHQALPSQRNNPRYQAARPWFEASYLLNAMFGYFFSKSDLPSRVGAGLTTIAMLPTSLAMHQTLEIGRTPVAPPERFLRRSVSYYTGWLTAASVVSIANLLQQSGVRVSNQTAARWSYGVLSMTGGLGWLVSRHLRDPDYLLPLMAAFTGVASKQARRNPGVAMVAGGWVCVLAGVMTRSGLDYPSPIEASLPEKVERPHQTSTPEENPAPARTGPLLQGM